MGQFVNNPIDNVLGFVTLILMSVCAILLPFLIIKH
jgi:hypothetical protein